MARITLKLTRVEDEPLALQPVLASVDDGSLEPEVADLELRGWSGDSRFSQREKPIG